MSRLGIAEASRRLSNTGWLTRVPADFRDRVLQSCRLIHVDRRQTVYAIGDPIGGPFGVAGGAVCVEIAPHEDDPKIGYVGTCGFWFGGDSLIAQQPRVVGVVAARPTTLLHIPAPEFEAIAAADPSAWRWLALLVAQMSLHAIDMVDDMMIPSSRGRVIAMLLSLSGCRRGEADGDEPSVDLTHEEVGGLANLSRSRLATILKELRAEGLIDCSYRTIRIIDPGGLRAALRNVGREGMVPPN